MWVHAPNSPSELITFHGSREDAIERLPLLDKSEQLELGHNRIGLAAGNQRVDLHIIAELPPEITGIQPLMLLEIRFLHVDNHAAHAFIQDFQHGKKPVLH